MIESVNSFFFIFPTFLKNNLIRCQGVFNMTFESSMNYSYKKEVSTKRKDCLLIFTFFLCILMFFSAFCLSQENKDEVKKAVLSEKNFDFSVDTDGSESPKIEVTYKDGKPEGKAILRYKDGSYIEGEYKNGYKNGQWIHYDAKGKKFKLESYVNGRLDGDCIIWSKKSGIKLDETHFIFGKPNGKQLHWSENGDLIVEENFKNGQWNGRVISWYSKGVKRQEGEFVDGTGKLKIWYPNGKLAIERELKNGQPFGTEICWYENGRKQRETVYKENGLVEKRTHWYNDGRVRFEESNINGHYIYKQWDEKGNLTYSD